MRTATKDLLPTPDDLRELFLQGPGMRVARWRQPNHADKWDEERDQAVAARAEENAEQFPAFAKKLTETIRNRRQTPTQDTAS